MVRKDLSQEGSICAFALMHRWELPGTGVVAIQRFGISDHTHCNIQL